MRKVGVVGVIVTCLILGAMVSAQRPQDTLLQAEAAYQEGNYASAAQLYQSLVETGIQSAALYQNLGSSYYQLGELGWALLYLRRAQLLDPRYRPIEINLRFVLQERIDRLEGEAELIDSLGTLTNTLLTLEELAWMTFGLWTLWFGLAAQSVLNSSWRGRVRTLIAGIGVVLLICLVLLLIRSYVMYQRPPAVVTVLSAQVMSGPGEDYLPLYEVYAAAEMRLLEERDGWARFILPDGRTGWISLEAVERV
jgi:tetratricopeptide (TPR) repeat protein